MSPEVALSMPCGGDELIGVLAHGDADSTVGVVIVVGGPQYRAGSHRQFVQLARDLARDGLPTLRFDCRGMGDSRGARRTFESIDDDIRVAIDALQAAVPAVRRVILWGLCDGATAAMMYAASDARVAGLVLANPWARASDTESRTLLWHYYLRRAFSAAFWRKLLTGEVRVGAALQDVSGHIGGAVGPAAQVAFRQRMVESMARFGGPALFVISEQDVTGREFDAFAQGAGAACFKRRARRDTRVQLAADHTFSGAEATRRASSATIEWIRTAVLAQ